MDDQLEFEALRRESCSWWHTARRKLLREAVAQVVHGKREARVLDLGCTAQLDSSSADGIRVLNAHNSLPTLAFRQIEGSQNLVCTSLEELGFVSNSFDAIVAGDILQMVPDDRKALRELRRVLKDGGLLCLTVPAYPFLWGEDDEARGHQRRYTATELRRKLNNCGFEIARVSYLVATGFVPSIAERTFKDLFRKSAALRRMSDEDSKLANAAMAMLLDCERHLIRYINLPFGTRVVCWARKPPLVAERVTVPAWERQWSRPPLPQGMSMSRSDLPESSSAS
jgi:ubiquinone/menaquinone biosynthesis C-methylase UbiE